MVIRERGMFQLDDFLVSLLLKNKEKQLLLGPKNPIGSYFVWS